MQKSQAVSLENKPESDDHDARRYHAEFMLATYHNDDLNIISLIEEVNFKLNTVQSHMGANALFLAAEREHVAFAQD